MAHTITKLRVTDYAAWQADWDGSVEMRGRTGQRHYHIFRMADDAHQLMLLIEWASMEQARACIGSAELAEVHKRAGVTESETWIVDEVEKGSA
jgi:uncharacterized protein (DUF1330 family)